MPGLGTLINALGIVLGGLLGLTLGKRLPSRVQEALMKANGVAVLFTGISGAMRFMLGVHVENTAAGVTRAYLDTQNTMLIIGCLALGALAGGLLDIERRLDGFGTWLRNKTHNEGDGGFVNAFVTASLTVCIGAMAVVGAVEDGANGDFSILAAKAVLDFVIILVMTVSLGRGCIFSAVPVVILQGLITALAHFISPYITDPVMNSLSAVGSVLIFCVGVNLVWDRRIPVGNMLPALAAAVVWGLVAG